MWYARLSLLLLLLGACDAREFWSGRLPQEEDAVTCQVDKDCPKGRRCETTHSRCVLCLRDGDCASGGSGGGAICDPMTGSCRGCRADAECRRHDPSHPFCDTAAGSCGAQCSNGTQCAARDPRAPYCFGDGTCRSCMPGMQCDVCAVNHDCASGLCLVPSDAAGGAPGSCAPAAQVQYVDRTATCPGSGSQAQPFCDLPQALATSHPGVPILVRASATPYSSVTLKQGSFTLYGPYSDPGLLGTDWTKAPAATISSSLSVLGPVQLTIDGIQVLAEGADGITCTPGAGQSATLTLRRALVLNGNQGINVGPGCTLTLEEGRIGGSVSAGLSIHGSTPFRVVNSLIQGTTGGAGVVLDAPGDFLFNTVVNNGAAVCKQAAMLGQSIFSGNRKTPGGSQLDLSGGCQPAQVVVGPGDSATGDVIRSAPEFDTDGFRLTASAADYACCIGKADSGPPLDFFGSPRSGRPTLGFNEPQ